MFDMFSYEFMQNAFLTGFLVSIASGIIGSLIVVNRMVFLAGGIAHASYGGIGVALFFALPMFLTTTIFSLFVALVLAYLTLQKSDSSDNFIGIIWAVGMAIGIILADMTPGYKSNLSSYLFGSILAVAKDEIYFMFFVDIIIITTVVIFYKIFLAISFDREFAKIKGVSVELFYTIILLLTALNIVISIKAVGLILIIALLTIPTYIAKELSNSLAKMMIFSSLFATIFTFIGLILSYYFDITSGASIILTATFGFVIFFLLRSFDFLSFRKWRL